MSSRIEFDFSKAVPERSSRPLTFVMRDHRGDLIPAASISGISATLKDLKTNTIINGRNAQAVRNVNGGVLTDGKFDFLLGELDNVVVSEGRFQKHRLLLTAVFTDSHGRTAKENQEVDFFVEDLEWVTN